jgi:RNA polymerase sigma-70 factor, ECF subfamily
LERVKEPDSPLSRRPQFRGKVLPAPPLYTEVEAGGAVADDLTDPLVRPRSAPSRALSFQEVYRTFFDDVCRWIWALGGPDVFLIVHRRLHTFDGKNLAGWLYQITRHRVRDFRRLLWFRLFLTRARMDDARVDDAGVSPFEGPEAALGNKETRQLLARLLSKLPESQRAAFVLFEVEGYSGEEIARLQGVPLNTVWARIRKARTKLAANLKRLREDR